MWNIRRRKLVYTRKESNNNTRSSLSLIIELNRSDFRAHPLPTPNELFIRHCFVLFSCDSNLNLTSISRLLSFCLWLTRSEILEREIYGSFRNSCLMGKLRKQNDSDPHFLLSPVLNYSSCIMNVMIRTRPFKLQSQRNLFAIDGINFPTSL